MRGRGWWGALWLLSACLQPEGYNFPAGASAGAQTAVWLIPDEAPVVQALGEDLAIPLQLRGEGVRPRVLLYGCAPEELRFAARFARDACVYPTARQYETIRGEPTLQVSTAELPFPACGPCALWPTTLRHQLRMPDLRLNPEVGVALPDGQLLITAYSILGAPTFLVDPQAGTIVEVHAAEGGDLEGLGPFWRDDSGLYALHEQSVWRIELDGTVYRAEQLTGPHPGRSYNQRATLLRRDGEFEVATAFGGLVRTSRTSTSGWIQARPNWKIDPLEPGCEDCWSVTSMATVAGGGLAAVGVAWEKAHYRRTGGQETNMLGYYLEHANRTGWFTLPDNQQVVSVVRHQGQALVISRVGESYLVGPDGQLEPVWSPKLELNLRFARGGAGRVWAAPNGGTIVPLFPDRGAECPRLPVGFGVLVLVSETALLHADGPNVTIAEVSPIKDCGLPSLE